MPLAGARAPAALNEGLAAAMIFMARKLVSATEKKEMQMAEHDDDEEGLRNESSETWDAPPATTTPTVFSVESKVIDAVAGMEERRC